jgi:hypothetical protein
MMGLDEYAGFFHVRILRHSIGRTHKIRLRQVILSMNRCNIMGFPSPGNDRRLVIHLALPPVLIPVVGVVHCDRP